MSDFFALAVGALCVWRLTHLFVAEDGPASLLVRFRRSLGDGFWGSLLDCFYCLSLWTAVPVALLLRQAWSERFVWWLALSAGAILIERTTQRPAVSPAPFFEDKEVPDELLWSTEDPALPRASHSDAG
jgi:hypothetical protein